MYDHQVFQKIFTLEQCFDQAMEDGHKFRDVEIEAVAKTLSCRTHKLGKKTYCCSNPDCSHTKHILNTCKCKLCPSCGQKSTEIWMAKQFAILPDCDFRHLTFTMPDLFWPIFQLNRHLLGALFSITAGTLLAHGKTKGLTPGIFSALHTYGRKLNFNCHIHLSVAKFAINRHGDLKAFSFPFATIMEQWRYGVIKLLRENFNRLSMPKARADDGKDRQSFNRFLNSQYERRWNVDIAKKTTHKKHTIKYLGAYIKKPPISASRLAHYHAGEVTFTYLDHYSKKHQTLTLPQKEMMQRVLSHVPEKHFKMIRYYGFLSNRLRGALLPLLYNVLGQPKQGVIPTFTSMMKAFLRTDPYQCILCKSRMVFSGFTAGLKLWQLVFYIKNIARQRPI